MLGSQCNTNLFEYSDNRYRIIDIRIRILKFLNTNIFNISIWSICWGQIYSIFVFGLVETNDYIQYSYSVKSFINRFIFIDRQQISPGTCINMNQNLSKIYFIIKGVNQKFAFYIFNIPIRPRYEKFQNRCNLIMLDGQQYPYLHDLTPYRKPKYL